MAQMPAIQAPQVISYKGRERGGLDTMCFDETFVGTTINTSQWQQSTSTMTIAQASGALTLNSGASIANGASAILQSYMGVGSPGGFPTHLEFKFTLSQLPQTGNVVELGAGFVSGTSTPTDGVFFRLNSSGVIQLVLNNNGTEIVVGGPSTTSTPPDWTWATNVRYHLVITFTERFAEFRLNEQYIGVVYPAGAPGGAVSTSPNLLTSSNSWPIVARTFNSASTTLAQKVNLFEVCCLNGDADDYKPWPHVVACAGWNAMQGRTGSGTTGQTAQWSNSAQPSSATLSNTAAGYTAFGGKFQFAAVNGAETDFALFAFQNPTGTATVPGAQLHITGVRISTTNTGATVATTATILEWALGVGSTAVSLATAQSASAKAPCRIPLGMQGFRVGDLIGYTPADIDHPFTTPPVVNPTEFIHVIVRVPVGTNTASEVFRGTVLLEGYYD